MRSPATSIRFSVRDRLGECIVFVVEDALRTDAFVCEAARWKQAIFRRVLSCIATVTVAWKSWRVGRCDFTIDARGIERTSRRGRSRVSWSRVQAAHGYRRGFLVELGQGAVPIPFRVLDTGACGQLEQPAGPRLRPGGRDMLSRRRAPAHWR